MTPARRRSSWPTTPTTRAAAVMATPPTCWPPCCAPAFRTPASAPSSTRRRCSSCKARPSAPPCRCNWAARPTPAWAAVRWRCDATVLLHSDGRYFADGPMTGGLDKTWGPTVVLRVQGIEILVVTQPAQMLDLAQFTAFGIDPRQQEGGRPQVDAAFPRRVRADRIQGHRLRQRRPVLAASTPARPIARCRARSSRSTRTSTWRTGAASTPTRCRPEPMNRRPRRRRRCPRGGWRWPAWCRWRWPWASAASPSRRCCR